MLYLEDYLEMIEHLPQELRDRFTELREMDLQVQNDIDSLEERAKQFFYNAKKMKPTERDVEYAKIRQDYYKSLEDADEKVHISNQIYDLVDRYLRRLHHEVSKFKMELEADNSGITEILERRSLELDNPSPVTNSIPINNIKAEKRKHMQSNISCGYPPEKRPCLDKALTSIVCEVLRGDSISGNRTVPAGHSSSSSSSTSSNSSAGSISEKTAVLPPHSKNHPYGGGNALAAAASQAIAATQQSLKRASVQSQSNPMQQGRRTASLKASYEAVNSGLHVNLSKELTLGARDITAMAAPTPAVTGNVNITTENKTKTNKKSSRANHITQPAEPPPPVEDSEDSSPVDENGSNADWTFDPNEPRYCICNQVSYGDMVACDNEDCPFEWFHYQCVGITQPPKGKWYCPQCTASMKRRGRKEK